MSELFGLAKSVVITAAPLTRDAADRIREQWLDAARDPASLLIAPTLLDVVGRKQLHD